MKRLIVFYFTLLVCALLSENSVNAQWSAGVKGGISIPNLTTGGSENNPLNTGYNSRLGADVAIFGEYHISHLFSLEASIEYSSQGGKKDGKQATPVPAPIAEMYPPGYAPKYLWATFNQEAKLNYLMIPVLGKFTFDLGHGSAWKFYIDAGPFVGFLLNAKTVATGYGNIYADEAETQPLLPAPIDLNATADIKDSLRSTNFGIEGNIGLSYLLGPGRLFLEAGGNYGFVNIQKNKDDGQNNTGAATVRIGYAFSFSSKAHPEKAAKNP
jgi:Outer membrane protein beta-barrel domain